MIERFRRPRLALAALGIFLILLLISLPLRAALGWADLGAHGIGAREAQGSVWSGTVRDLTVAETPLGSARARLHFFPLFIGQLRFTLKREPGGNLPPLTARIVSGIGGFTIDYASVTIPAGRIFGQLPVREIVLENVSARFSGDRCIHAEGNVRAAVDPVLPGLDLPGGMIGTLRCEGAALLVPLVSQTGLEKIDLRITGDGRYTARLSLSGERTNFAVPLGAAGLRPADDGYAIDLKGRF